MKNLNRILLLIFLISPLFIIAQNGEVNRQVLSSPVRYESDKNTGSGVFISDRKNIYFVTANHVLFSQNSAHSLITNIARLVFYPGNLSSNFKQIITTDLLGNLGNKKIKSDTIHDIAVIWLGSVTEKGGIDIFDENKLEDNNRHKINFDAVFINDIKNYQNTNIGEEIFLSGYPSSIGLSQSPQFDYSIPLLKKGIVAGKFEERKTFIIDCPAFYGNSGGPVFLTETHGIGVTNYHSGLDKQFYLIGIVIEYIPYIERWQNQSNGFVNITDANSGYSVVTSIDNVLELIKSFQK